jgi:hypothetical protein
MTKTPLSAVRVAAFCLLLAGCGEENGAPTGSTITVSPDLKDWTIGAVACDNSEMQSTFFNIVVKNPNGIPMTGVDIRVSLDLTLGTFITPSPGYAAMYLYDDDVSTTDPITTFQYFTKTGAAGAKTLRVQYDLTCTYAGDLEVHSGSSFGSAHISVEFEAP